MKSKFKNLDFSGVEILSNEEKSKVQGGYWSRPATCGPTGQVFPTLWQCFQACGSCV